MEDKKDQEKLHNEWAALMSRSIDVKKDIANVAHWLSVLPKEDKSSYDRKKRKYLLQERVNLLSILNCLNKRMASINKVLTSKK